MVDTTREALMGGDSPEYPENHGNLGYLENPAEPGNLGAYRLTARPGFHAHPFTTLKACPNPKS